MKKTVDLYYDFISPASYFAFVRLNGICRKKGAVINYKPMLLGGVFKENGNTTPMNIPAKWEWMKTDFARTAEYYQIPYQLNPHFPFSTVAAMRGAMWAQEVGCIEDYSRAMYQAVWVDAKNISDPSVLREVLENAGFNVEQVMETMTEPAYKQALILATTDAAERGVFGAPTMFMGSEIYFGQDRLDWIERAL